jgi:hypothetical protein
MAARPLDTSTLGPIRVTPLPAVSRARKLYAEKVEALGPPYRNVANSIRAGWSNIWIDAGIRAVAEVLRYVPDDE